MFYGREPKLHKSTQVRKEAFTFCQPSMCCFLPCRNARGTAGTAARQRAMTMPNLTAESMDTTAEIPMLLVRVVICSSYFA